MDKGSFEVTDSLLSTCAEVLCCTILGMVYSYNGGSLGASGAKGKLQSAIVVMLFHSP